jgi:hypothetical protein
VVLNTQTQRSHKDNSENDIILEMHHVGNYEDFSFIDNNLQYYNENEDCKKAIFKQITEKTPEDIRRSGNQ